MPIADVDWGISQKVLSQEVKAANGRLIIDSSAPTKGEIGNTDRLAKLIYLEKAVFFRSAQQVFCDFQKVYGSKVKRALTRIQKARGI